MRVYFKAGNAVDAGVVAMFSGSIAEYSHIRQRQVHGKQALVEAGYGKGRVVLFGFRPQFRGQLYGAFKFLLNAINLASAQPLRE